jgi:hypothetical protein
MVAEELPREFETLRSSQGPLAFGNNSGLRRAGEGRIRMENKKARKGETMRKRIQDEFTEMPISRQRKYQLRMQRDKRCTECGQPAIQGSRCLKHLVKARERQRTKRGLKRRYYNTLSYRLENVS